MSIQQRLTAREPLEAWSVREKLCLAAAVGRSGDQNWMTVSRALRAAGDPTRPPDWYRQKSCAAQYGALLEAEETPKRKKRTSDAPSTDTPQESILKRLTAERISELQQLMQDIKSQYAVLKDEVAEARSPATGEARVREMLSSVEAVRRQRERDQQRHALWLREREERRARAERARRPLVSGAAPGGLSPPASSPLLTSLLKNTSPGAAPAQSVAQVLHIPHPSTVVDTVSPSAGAPTLSMLLEKGREGAPPPPAPAPPPPPAPNETAVIEHIKSQLQEIEHNLRLGAMRGAPLAPAVDKLDIDDIEIKAEDVYAFSDMDLDIPPVSSIHKSSLARSIDKSIFNKKEEAEESAASDFDVPPLPPDPAPRRQETEAAEEVTAVEPAPAAEALAEEPKPEPPVEPVTEPAAPPDNILEIPIPGEPPSPVAAPPVEEAADAEPGGDAPADTGADTGGDASPAPPPGAERPLESPTPEDPVEAEMKVMHSEAPAGAEAAVEAEPGVKEEAAEAAPPAESAPDLEVVKEEPAAEKSEEAGGGGAAAAEGEDGAEGEGDGGEPEAEVKKEAESTIPVALLTPIKRDYSVMEWEAEESGAEGGGGGGGGADERPSETDEAHTETDDDTPMEVIREEETEGRKRRDYSRRKTQPLPDSRACSGSESAAETSAPPSPAPRAAADPERERRLWRKSVLLVYNRLCAHKYASLFLRPITDEVAPDYSLVVRRPMDLHTIKRNIDSGLIRTTAEFQRDVLLMLSNALLYNNSRDRVHHMARDMHDEAASQLGMLLQAQAHAALSDAQAAPPARRAHPLAKRKRTASGGAAGGSPAPKRPRDE